MLHTDEWSAYKNLQNDFGRGIVHHSVKEFVSGDCHTNGIESFWALFKRGYHGVYHQMSKKHLQRYVNEFTFRITRKAWTMQNVFSEVVANATDGRAFAL